jgi:Trk-type K+ transport system membrane component
VWLNIAIISNVGLGFDAVAPTMNFSTLREPTQEFLGWMMILGCLELCALLVIFTPQLWKTY